MNQYNIDTEEIIILISLYSKLFNTEKRMFAQGYLKRLAEESAVQ